MTRHKNAVFSAFAGFTLTVLIQLPPILEARADSDLENLTMQRSAEGEQVDLAADAPARLGQLLRSQS